MFVLLVPLHVIIGLVALLYVHRKCRKCKLGAKLQHPAPQCLSMGWCCGCGFAVLGCFLGGFGLMVAGVSGEMCMFMDELTTPAGLETYGPTLGMDDPRTIQGFQACLFADQPR